MQAWSPFRPRRPRAGCRRERPATTATTALLVLDLVGTFAFALNGALNALRARAVGPERSGGQPGQGSDHERLGAGVRRRLHDRREGGRVVAGDVLEDPPVARGPVVAVRVDASGEPVGGGGVPRRREVAEVLARRLRPRPPRGAPTPASWSRPFPRGAPDVRSVPRGGRQAGGRGGRGGGTTCRLVRRRPALPTTRTPPAHRSAARPAPRAGRRPRTRPPRPTRRAPGRPAPPCCRSARRSVRRWSAPR